MIGRLGTGGPISARGDPWGPDRKTKVRSAPPRRGACRPIKKTYHFPDEQYNRIGRGVGLSVPVGKGMWLCAPTGPRTRRWQGTRVARHAGRRWTTGFSTDVSDFQRPVSRARDLPGSLFGERHPVLSGYRASKGFPRRQRGVLEGDVRGKSSTCSARNGGTTAATARDRRRSNSEETRQARIRAARSVGLDEGG